MNPFAAPIRLTYGYAYAVAFMPDGKTLMIGTHGGALLWDFHHRRILRNYHKHGHPAQHVAVTPDGFSLVAGSTDNGQAFVWNIADATVRHQISADAQGLWWMAVSPCGGKLLTCGKKSGLRCWDLHSGALTLSIPVRTDKPWRAAWSFCGQQIAHSSGTRRVRVIDAGSGATVLRIDTPCKEVASLAFHPDGRLFTGLKNGTIQIWDIEKGLWKKEFACRDKAVDDIIFSRDGRFMLERGSGKGTTVQITDLNTGKRVQCENLGSNPEQRNIDLSPDGRFWAGANYGYEVGVFRTGKTGAHRVLTDDFAYLYSARFTPDGQSVLVGNHMNGEALYRAGDGARLWARHKRESYGQAWAISPDNRWMLSGMDDGNVILRDMKDGREIARRPLHSRQVFGVTFLARGNRIVTLGHEGTMAVSQFLPPKGGEESRIKLLRRLGLGCMNDAKLSGDGSVLLTASSLGVHVWDAQLEALIYQLDSENMEISELFLSPDNRFAAGLAGFFHENAMAFVWDLCSGRQLCKIRGAEWRGAAFSPDGHFFCLCGGRKERGVCCQVVQARATETGKVLWTTRFKDGGYHGIAITPDGRKVVILHSQKVRHRCGKDFTRGRRYRHEYAPRILVLDARTGSEMIQYRQHLPAVKELPGFLSDGATPSFLSVEDGEVRLRNALDAASVKRLSLHPGWAKNARLSPGGTHVYLDGPQPALWDTQRDQKVASIYAGGPSCPTATTPHRHLTHTTEYVRITDFSRQATRTYCLGHYSQHTRIFALPDGEHVLVVGEEQCALWNPDHDSPEWTMRHDSELFSAAVSLSPDGGIVAFGLRDKTEIAVVSLQTGRLLGRIITPTPVLSTAFSPDGMRLTATFGTLGIRVWEVASGMEVMSVPMTGGAEVHSACYSPDGTRILAYGYCEGAVPEATIWMLDPSDGCVLAAFPGEHPYTVTDPFSPDGTKVLTQEGDVVFVRDISVRGLEGAIEAL